MTEQEAQALVARLERVWGIAEVSPHWGQVKMSALTKFATRGVLEAKLAPYIYLRVTQWRRGPEKGALCFVLRDSTKVAGLESHPDGSIEWTLQSFVCNTPEQLEAFSIQLMPVFRRGCWLSGCPTEASAHEKAEWMQGFTREEIQSWNLDFS